MEITAAGTFDKWPASAWVSGKGVAAEPTKDKGKYKVFIAPDAVPGLYWFRAHTDEGASPVRPFLVGMLPEVEEKEPNDEPGKSHALGGPSFVVNGRLAKAGDVDGFAVKLKKGDTLVASLEANRTLKSPMDAMLQVVTPEGFVVAANNDFQGLDPQVAFTAPNDGTYIARVFAFPSTPDSSIRFAGADTFVYRLTLTTAGFADYAVPMAVQSGVEPKFELKGWNIPSGSPTLAGGRPLATLFHPRVANPVRVFVEAHPVHGFVPPSTVLAPPFSAAGQIAKPGGDASFTVAGKKATALNIRVESRSLGLAVEPVVRVLGADKAQLARAEPGKIRSDANLAFTPTADGNFTVAVSDLFGGGSPRHALLLRVVTAEPDYDLSVANDRFATPPGKPLDIPIKIARRGGFAKPVEIVAEGLPEDVKLEVKPPAGKADPNAVTVTLSCEKKNVSAPFRLIGRVKDAPTLTRSATAPLAEFEETTADLWLSVTETPVATPVPKKKK